MNTFLWPNLYRNGTFHQLLSVIPLLLFVSAEVIDFQPINATIRMLNNYKYLPLLAKEALLLVLARK